MGQGMKNGGQQITGNIEEFNRTVVITKSDIRKNVNQATPLQRITKGIFRKKQELEDLIGGANISHYTHDRPDTTSQLEAPLSKLDTRYSVIEEFRGAARQRFPLPATRTCGGWSPSNP